MAREAHSDKLGDAPIDLLALVRAQGWSPARITALCNTCAAAAGTETMPAPERALAAAVATALAGGSPGISPAQLAFLQRLELLDLPTGRP